MTNFFWDYLFGEPLTYDEAVRECVRNYDELKKQDIRIVFGTRYNAFYFIDETDKDYDVWGMSIDDFLDTSNENEAEELLTRGRRI